LEHFTNFLGNYLCSGTISSSFTDFFGSNETAQFTLLHILRTFSGNLELYCKVLLTSLEPNHRSNYTFEVYLGLSSRQGFTYTWFKNNIITTPMFPMSDWWALQIWHGKVPGQYILIMKSIHADHFLKETFICF
jgi:hypothetical protein